MDSIMWPVLIGTFLINVVCIHVYNQISETDPPVDTANPSTTFPSPHIMEQLSNISGARKTKRES